MATDKDYSSLEPLASQPEFCTSVWSYEWINGEYVLVALPEPCNIEIKAMSFKGTGVCGEVHRKATAAGADQDLKS